jgi:hypothetical protein
MHARALTLAVEVFPALSNGIWKRLRGLSSDSDSEDDLAWLILMVSPLNVCIRVGKSPTSSLGLV